MYTAESDTTCAGSTWISWLPDARCPSTFAEWGADYLEADGCGDPTIMLKAMLPWAQLCRLLVVILCFRAHGP